MDGGCWHGVFVWRIFAAAFRRDIIGNGLRGGGFSGNQEGGPKRLMGRNRENVLKMGLTGF